MSTPRTRIAQFAATVALFGLGVAACGEKEPPAPPKARVVHYGPQGELVGGVKPTATPSFVIVCLSGVRFDEAFRTEGGTAAMPRLARFAKESVSFENAASPCAWDVPAFVSTLIGLAPTQHTMKGIYGDRIALESLIPSVVTLAEILGKGGYATAAMTRGGPYARGHGVEQGFESYEEGWRLEGTGVERTAGWIGKRPAGRPFLLVLHADDASAPYVERAATASPSADEPELVRGAERVVAAATKANGTVSDDDAPDIIAARLFSARASTATDGLEALDVARSLSRRLASPWGAGPAGDELAAKARDAYRTNLARVDRLFGALLDRIAATDLPTDTITIVFSDHGEALGERREARAFGAGGSLMDEHVHVPLVIHAPGRLAPASVHGSCSLVDVMPTVLDLCGLPRHGETGMGWSLLPLIAKPGGKGLATFSVEYVAAQTPQGMPVRRTLYALRTARTKYVATYDPGTRQYTEEVYDLSADPGEMKLLSSDHVEADGPDLVRLVHGLREDLAGHLKGVLERAALGYGTTD